MIGTECDEKNMASSACWFHYTAANGVLHKNIHISMARGSMLEGILYGLWFNWNVELFAILRNAIQIKHSMEMWLPVRYNDYG